MNYVNIACIISCGLARFAGKIFVSEHSTFSDNVKSSNWLTSRALTFLIPRLYTRADKVIAVSDGVAADLCASVSLPSDKVTTVHNPVDISAIQSKSVEVLEHPWFLPGSPPVVIGVGRLVKVKDFGTLIKSFEILRKKIEIKLVILGEGTEREFLQKMVQESLFSDDILLPGYDDNPYKWMSNSDVFCLSSRSEGFGNVLVEAMACGTQVVSTNCPNGPSEILEGGRWGGLVPVGDPVALATAIMAALESNIDVRIRADFFDSGKIVNSYKAVFRLT